MAESEGVPVIPGREDVYYCFRCQNTFLAVEPVVCPGCSSGFIEFLSPGMNEPDQGIFDFHPQFVARSRVSDDADASQVGSGYNNFDVESVTDLIGQMHLYDALYDDHIPQSRSEIPAGYTPDDAVMDPFEWDRILSWFFENGGAFLTGGARLSEEQIESIPVIHLEAKDIEKTSTCPICIDDFKVKEEAKFLPCKHFFHKECIVSWLKVRANCPVCRENVEVDERARSCGMVLRVPDSTDTSLMEAPVTSNEESCVEDGRRRHSLSGVYCDFSEHSDTGGSASGSSGTQNQRALNSPVCNGRRTSHDARISQHHYDTNRSEHAAPHSALTQTSERATRRHSLLNPHQRNYSARLPSDGRASRRSTYSLSGGHLSSINTPYLADLSLGNPQSASYSNQPGESVGRNSANLLRYQRNSSDSSFDGTSNRHQSSSSSSLEDLSSVVPVLPPNIFL